MNRFLCTAIMVLVLINFSSAQFYFRSNPVVTQNGNTLSDPWGGGLNNCIPSEIDIDLDGKNDLMFFDMKTNKPSVFLNKGSAGNISYQYSIEYAQYFTQFKDWILCHDYDCDGKADIFTHSNIQGNVAVYKNTSTPGNVQFTLMTTQLMTNFGPLPTNIYASTEQAITFWDLDNDLDLDIFAWPNFPDGTIFLHRNKSSQLGFGCDSLIFVTDTFCWGKMVLCLGTNGVCQFNASCSLFAKNPIDDWYANFDPSEAAKRDDTLSSLTAFDEDGDGDPELLFGDVNSEFSLMAHNGGSNVIPIADTQDQTFPSYDKPALVRTFIQHGVCDANNDARKDLLFCAIRDYNNHSVWLYTDTATNPNPYFHFNDSLFLQGDMIETGAYAFPQFFDYNGDGLMDLIVGNEKYFPAENGITTGLMLLKNTGTAQSPQFELLDRNFADVNSLNLATGGATPSFGDMDNDGDKDMIIGTEDGQLHYFANNPIGSTANFVLTSPNYFSIDVGNYSMPQIIDLNTDGKLDLVIGRRRGWMQYFENTGTATNPQFSATPTKDTLGGINVAPIFAITGYAAPAFYKENGVTKLAIGSELGQVYLYDNIDGNILGNYNLVQTLINGTEGPNVAPAVFDINGNGSMDLCIGNRSGGLGIYYNSASAVDEQITPAAYVVYPNPATNTVTVTKTMVNNASSFNVRIYSSMGQEVKVATLTATDNTLDISSLSRGVYTVVIENATGGYRLIKL